MKNKIFLPLLFIASVILIAGFFMMTPSYLQLNGDVKHFEDSDMSFDMNSTWTVGQYDDALLVPFLSGHPSSITLAPTSKTAYSYYNGSIDDLTANGTVLNTSTTNATDVVIVQTEITRMDKIPDNLTIDQVYKSDSLYKVMENTGSFVLDNSTTLTIDGKTAHQFRYTVTYTQYVDTWIESNGHYYRILSQAPTSVFPVAQEQFDYTLNSLKIKN